MSQKAMSVTIKGTMLVIEIPMQDPTPSASGKTLVVATTRGNIQTGVNLPKGGKEIVLGLNAYVSAR